MRARTDVVNRLTGKRSILELAGTLTEDEGEELRRKIDEIRSTSGERLSKTAKRMSEPC